MINDYYTITSAAAEDPVTLAEAKAWCKKTTDEEDDIFTALISAATAKAELITNRVFVERTYTGYFSGIECYCRSVGSYTISTYYIALRRGPVIDTANVTSVTVTVDDSDETVSTDDYNVQLDDGFSRIVFEEINESPDSIPYPYQVAFTAGYGAASAVPEPIKTAIKEIVHYWYQNRGDCDESKEVPNIAKGILKEYRILNTYG
jgi:uncharacterized phiE125 gp8 family phage protein